MFPEFIFQGLEFVGPTRALVFLLSIEICRSEMKFSDLEAPSTCSKADVPSFCTVVCTMSSLGNGVLSSLYSKNAVHEQPE